MIPMTRDTIHPIHSIALTKTFPAVCLSRRAFLNWNPGPRRGKMAHHCSAGVGSTPMKTPHTAQYSLSTSAERIARALLKNCIISLHNIFVRLKRICHLVRTCLTLCCSLTCRLPRAHHLPHSFFLLPRPEHALQSGQHDLLQEHPVHH